MWATVNSSGTASTVKLYTAGTMCAEVRRNTIGGLVTKTFRY